MDTNIIGVCFTKIGKVYHFNSNAVPDVGGGEQLAQATEIDFLDKLPIDQNVRIGGDSGKPIVVSFPRFFRGTGVDRNFTEDCSEGICFSPGSEQRPADQYC